MKKKTKFNIRRKVLLILYVVLSFTIIGNFVISGALFERSQIRAFDKEAFATARGLQSNIDSLIEKSFLPYTEISNCEVLLDNFVKNSEDTLYVYTTDVDGNLLYASEGAVYGRISKSSLKEYIVSDKEYRIDDKKKDTLYYILPLHDTGKFEGQQVVSQVGAMVVAYPRECITEPVIRLYIYNAVLAAVTFIISLVVIFMLMTRWFTEPLQKLDAAINKVSRTGVIEKNALDIHTNDEIGQIAQSFNDMLMQLKVTTVSKNYIDSILTNMSEALFVVNKDMRIEMLNDAAVKLLGYSSEEIKGRTVESLYATSRGDSYKGQGSADAMTAGKLIDNEAVFRTRSGEEVSVSINWSAVTDMGRLSKYICTARDVTDIKKAQDILMRHANYDQLTGISNRYGLEQNLERILKEGGLHHFFVVIDLDKFKPINDACGHAAGDKLLKQVAYMLKLTAGEDNMVARIGGDEFAIIFYNTDVETVSARIEELLTDVRNYNFAWEGKMFKIGMSIGAYEICEKGLDRLTVFSSADTACYIAKMEGGNKLHIFTEADREIGDKADEEIMMKTIVEALENSRYILKYQPIVPTNGSDSEYIYDILVKLMSESGEEIEPQQFMSIAGRYNKLLSMDKWTIHHFCENYSSIAGMVKGVPCFNINLSKDSISSEEFLEYVLEEMKTYSVPASAVCFNISESCAVSNFTDATKFIKNVRAKGYKFAIDEFGTGVSSFNYLKLMPVDIVKIDGSYMAEIGTSEIDAAVVKSINEITHLLGVKTIAAGVNNKTALAEVKKLGLDYVQGDMVGKPGELIEVMKS